MALKTDKKISNDQLKILIFGKYLFTKAREFCNNPEDKYKFFAGINLLHDAIDVIGGLASSFLGIIKDKDRDYYMMDYMKDINKQMALPNFADFKTLNEIRNNIKHKALFFDTHHYSYLPNKLYMDILLISNEVFKLDFDKLSLKILIHDVEIIEKFNQIEGDLRNNEHRNAIIKMTELIYEQFERRFFTNPTFSLSTFTWPHADTTPNPFEALDIYDKKITIALLSLGIDPDDYYQFKKIVPEMVWNSKKKTNEIHWKYEFDFDDNWTEINLSFCYNFLLELVIKKQEKEYKFNDLVSFSSVRELVLRPKKDEAIFYVPQSNGVFTGERSFRELLRLHKGEEIIGMVYESNDEKLLVHSKKFEEIGGHDSIAFVNRDDVDLDVKKRDD